MKRNGRYWMCARKDKLKQGYAKQVIHRSKLLGRIMYCYQCPYCGWWHMTKKRQWDGEVVNN